MFRALASFGKIYYLTSQKNANETHRLAILMWVSEPALAVFSLWSLKILYLLVVHNPGQVHTKHFVFLSDLELTCKTPKLWELSQCSYWSRFLIHQSSIVFTSFCAKFLLENNSTLYVVNITNKPWPLTMVELWQIWD